MRFLKIFLILFVSVVFLSCSRPSEREGAYMASMQVKGSDTIVNLIQVWAEKVVENNPLYNIGVTGGGSYGSAGGLPALIIT